uniref:Methylmalonyl-CoA mutase n=1 Tax=Candidatus Kentrum sp. LFY TaxID=2126342 RepID=A0A450V3E8_9GAMM|nr:MAG: Methylmalonyl-CoA mutase [Candidatus Kentron sp. LFY]
MNRNPDFTTLSYDAIGFPASGFEAWKKQAEKLSGKPLDELVSKTMEHIDVKPLYTKEDLSGFDYLDYVAGIPPYLRGPYPSMYVTRPWTVRQYAGFSTAEESNAFYRRNLAAGQMGLSIAFRSRHPPGLRLRQPARRRRRRQGRSRHRLHGKYGYCSVCNFSRSVSENYRLTGRSCTRWEHPLRRHPAGQDVRLHDHERRRPPRPLLLHRLRRKIC